MLQQLKSEIKNIKPNFSELRKFGLILSGLIFFWAIFLASAAIMLYCIVLSLFLSAVSFFKPKTIKPVYLALMFVAITIEFFLFRMFLTIVFFLVLTPIGLLVHGIKKDKFPDPETESYWSKCNSNE